MSKARYLTKSRYKLAKQCPTKLYYTGKPAEYPDIKHEDPFLKALADGGIQVGELAKCYHPGGIDINTLDYQEALDRTNEALKKDKVIIYEAALRYQDCFVRVDILIKNGKRIDLIEVKSKSIEGFDEKVFLNKSGTITSDWIEYIEDITFQTWVGRKSFPNYDIYPALMLIDKTVTAPEDGMNRKFILSRDPKGRTRVKINGDVSPKALGTSIMRIIPLPHCVEMVMTGQAYAQTPELSFEDEIAFFVKEYTSDHKIDIPVSFSRCNSCEFRADASQEKQGMKSGFKECWKSQYKLKDKDFLEPWINQISRLQARTADKNFLPSSKILLDQIDNDDLLGLSERQRLQVEKTRKQDSAPWFDRAFIRRELSQWKFPLHFIDFETAASPIPFFKGIRPYEHVVFQFSHHLYHEDGTYEHHGEFLGVESDSFPNFEFLRALKKELDQDQGTILRYSPYENTMLNVIYAQIERFKPADAKELKAFIEKITEPTERNEDKWIPGPRNMVDMLPLIQNGFYQKRMEGSNSIKVVLPAMLQSIKPLQKKYSQPVYGDKAGIKSLNFDEKIWFKKDENGEVLDPYRLLDPLVDDKYEDELALIAKGDRLADGGAAMMAYAKLQYTDITPPESKLLREGLLRYCELDTLAMVMIYEGLKA